MSRSGYSDDCENIALYRNAVDRATYGKRGQAFLKELVATLEAMPEKRLVADVLVEDTGEVCALGAVCKARGFVEEGKRYYGAEHEVLSQKLDIAPSLVAEIEYENDENGRKHELVDGYWQHQEETPEARYQRVLAWAKEHILQD